MDLWSCISRDYNIQSHEAYGVDEEGPTPSIHTENDVSVPEPHLLLTQNQQQIVRFLRMSPERFEHLYRIVGPHMKTGQCRSREPIANAERLALTTRYLASGDSQQSMSFNFR
eukprot:gene2027-2306_t